jgi:hypothetical protein
MKRKRNRERADRENRVWVKEIFSRARKARDVLPEIFDKQAAVKMLNPRLWTNVSPNRTEPSASS